jgi:hypothetical protein
MKGAVENANNLQVWYLLFPVPNNVISPHNNYHKYIKIILMPWIPCIFVQLHIDPTKCTTFII